MGRASRFGNTMSADTSVPSWRHRLLESDPVGYFAIGVICVEADTHGAFPHGQGDLAQQEHKPGREQNPVKMEGRAERRPPEKIFVRIGPRNPRKQWRPGP